MAAVFLCSKSDRIKGYAKGSGRSWGLDHGWLILVRGWRSHGQILVRQGGDMYGFIATIRRSHSVQGGVQLRLIGFWSCGCSSSRFKGISPQPCSILLFIRSSLICLRYQPKNSHEITIKLSHKITSIRHICDHFVSFFWHMLLLSIIPILFEGKPYYITLKYWLYAIQ